MVVALVLIILILLLVALRSRHHKRHPSTSLLNATGIVETPLNPNGAVLINGELWLAKSINGTTIPAKTKIIVIGAEAHLLLVT